MVDAAPAIEHVRALHRKGMPLIRISRAAGIQVNKFYLGFYRDENNKMIPVLRMRAENRDKILAVEFEVDDIGEGFSGELVRRAREASGMTILGLSRMLDMDPNTVRRWERGENKPRFRRQVEKAAAILGVPYEQFFGPVEPLPQQDSYTEEYDWSPAPGVDDYIMTGYPCGVCGREFKSRIRLATHPHGSEIRKIREEDLI